MDAETRRGLLDFFITVARYAAVGWQLGGGPPAGAQPAQVRAGAPARTASTRLLMSGLRVCARATSVWQ